MKQPEDTVAVAAQHRTWRDIRNETLEYQAESRDEHEPEYRGGTVMRMAFVHSYGDAWYSRAIRWCTKGKYNHSLVLFESDFGDLTYWESYWKKDPLTGKTGVRGPVPWREMTEWIARKPKKRGAVIQWLPYQPSECVRALCYLQVCRMKIKYPLCQIISNLRTMVFGAGMRRRSVTPNEWTCSECVANVWALLGPKEVLSKLKIGYILFDMVAPSGETYGLCQAVRAWLDGIGKREEEEL